MKQGIIVVLLVLALAVGLISCASPDLRNQAEPEHLLDAVVQEMELKDDHYISKMKLHAGGYLLITDESPKDNPYDFKFIMFSIFTIKNGEITVDDEPLFEEDIEGSVRIFVENRDASNWLYLYKGYKGTDIILYIMPDFGSGKSFDESSQRSWTPYDNLDSQPFFFQDMKYHDNYPAWIFDIPLDQIKKDYELRYGDYLLTGQEILDLVAIIQGSTGNMNTFCDNLDGSF